MEEKLGQFLFSDNTLVYAILDGASVPDLPMQLFEMCPPHVCLYRGDLTPDLAEVAPYLVHLVPGTRFTNWLLSKGWGRHWGIFFQSPYPLIELRKHFRKFLTVHDEQGNPMLFRYYDPRVLPKFLPTCKPEELAQIFDKVTAYFAESKGGAQLVRLQLVGNEMKQWSFDMKPAPTPNLPPGYQPVQPAGFSYA